MKVQQAVLQAVHLARGALRRDVAFRQHTMAGDPDCEEVGQHGALQRVVLAGEARLDLVDDGRNLTHERGIVLVRHCSPWSRRGRRRSDSSRSIPRALAISLKIPPGRFWSM